MSENGMADSKTLSVNCSSDGRQAGEAVLAKWHRLLEKGIRELKMVRRQNSAAGEMLSLLLQEIMDWCEKEEAMKERFGYDRIDGKVLRELERMARERDREDVLEVIKEIAFEAGSQGVRDSALMLYYHLRMDEIESLFSQ